MVSRKVERKLFQAANIAKMESIQIGRILQGLKLGIMYLYQRV